MPARSLYGTTPAQHVIWLFVGRGKIEVNGGIEIERHVIWALWRHDTARGPAWWVYSRNLKSIVRSCVLPSIRETGLSDGTRGLQQAILVRHSRKKNIDVESTDFFRKSWHNARSSEKTEIHSVSQSEHVMLDKKQKEWRANVSLVPFVWRTLCVHPPLLYPYKGPSLLICCGGELGQIR